jgi:hypothetical protein
VRETVSLQEVRVYETLRAHGATWLTNREITALVPGVAERTVRAYTRRWVQLGLLETIPLFPAPRYRLASTATSRNRRYLQRLRESAVVFGAASIPPGALGEGSADISPLVARLDATRAAIGVDRKQDDSTIIIREARDERAAGL